MIDIKQAKIITIKVGSSIITNRYNIDEEKIKRVVDNAMWLLKRKKRVIIVSSGAIACGVGVLKLKQRPSSLSKLQACASIGQVKLMEIYGKYFAKYGYYTGQILLTRDILHNRNSYVNAKNCINNLFKYNTIPIINENDSVAVDEIKYGDNDMLAAMVANLSHSDTLIILSDVDGIYEDYGKKEQRLVPLIRKITPQIESIAGGKGSDVGTGGMKTKIRAARICMESGINVIIANGHKDNIIEDIFVRGKGTLFLANKNGISKKKHWLLYSSNTAGSIYIDKGAAHAIINGRSLLPAGITSISGNFLKGDVVEIFSNGKLIGKGITNYDSSTLEAIMGKRTSELSCNGPDEVINRENIALIQ